MPITKKLNQNFFESWTPQMAYVLGYFAADGCMYKNKRGACFIEFKSIDKTLLEKVRLLLGSDHKISKKVYPPDSNYSVLYRLQIGSKYIYNSLLKLGFSQAKSNIMLMPNVPVDLFSHFVRGYFDGDGHVSICKYQRAGRTGKSVTIISGFTSGSKKFLSKLQILLKKYARIVGSSLYRKEEGGV
jgi:intein-encoded DNA endonuclease-like protein